ncbi:MAG: hypothetical protein WCO86_02860 [Planctomycetota bacterium]
MIIQFHWFVILSLLLTTEQVLAKHSALANDSPGVPASYWFTGFPSIEATINGEKMVCFIATAASSHHIDKSKAGVLQGAARNGQTGTVTARGRDGDVSLVTEILDTFSDVTVATGGMQQEHQRFSVGNLSIISSFMSAAPDAILGTDLMKSKIMLLRHQNSDLHVVWKERDAYQPEVSFQRFDMRRNANRIPEVEVELPVLGTRRFLPQTTANECLAITADMAGVLLRSNAAVYGDASSRRSVDGLKVGETLIIRNVTVFGTTFENVPAHISGLGLNTVGMDLLRFFDLDFDVDGEVIFARLLQPERPRILGRRSAPFSIRFLSASKVVVEISEINAQRFDRKIKNGDELLECHGQVANRLSYWDLTDLLSTNGRAWKCRLRNENGIFDVTVQPDSEMTPANDDAFRSADSKANAFLESLRQ